MNFQQLLLLLTAIAVPTILLILRKNQLLVCWICFTFSVQIFDTVPYTNLPASRVVGIIYLPIALAKAKEWINIRPAKIFAYHYLYLAVLGLLFGFIDPWPDITMGRPFTLTAPGRTIIYLSRLLCDISLTVFITLEVQKPKSILLIGRGLVLGSSISSLTAIIGLILKLDIYEILSGREVVELSVTRAHGLAGEPRGLGLMAAYAIIILMLGNRKIYPMWVILMLINLTGLIITYSSSSYIVFGLGLVVLWLLKHKAKLWVTLLPAALAILLFVTGMSFLPQQFIPGAETIMSRLDPEQKLHDIPEGTFGQELAYRLDVFDGSALLFLLDNPVYALIGAGPGLVSLPASYYVPPGIYSVIWNPTIGINSLPFHGILLEVCNAGIVGLFLWIFQTIICTISLKAVAGTQPSTNSNHLSEWLFGYHLFVLGSIFYLVQIHSSPVWSVLLGIGWGSVLLFNKYKKETYPRLKM